MVMEFGLVCAATFSNEGDRDAFYEALKKALPPGNEGTKLIYMKKEQHAVHTADDQMLMNNQTTPAIEIIDA